MNSVSDSIAHSILYIDIVSDVWRELKERLSKTDRILVWKLKTKINNLKQGTNSVNDYYAELRSLWEVFLNLLIVGCLCIPQFNPVRHFTDIADFLSFSKFANSWFYACVKTQSTHVVFFLNGMDIFFCVN